MSKNNVKDLLNEAKDIPSLASLIKESNITVVKPVHALKNSVVHFEINDNDSELVNAIKNLINSLNITAKELNDRLLNKKGDTNSIGYYTTSKLDKGICSCRQAIILAEELGYKLDIQFIKKKDAISFKYPTSNVKSMNQIISLVIKPDDEWVIKELKKLLNKSNLSKNEFYNSIGDRAKAYGILERNFKKNQYSWDTVEQVARACNYIPKIRFKKI